MKAIDQLIETYFEAYCSADGDTIARAFHPECRLYSTSEKGLLEATPLSDWLVSLRARRARGEVRSGGTLEIASIDATGDSAAVKAVLRFPGLVFTDYLSLLRIEGTWRIVGKVYSVAA